MSRFRFPLLLGFLAVLAVGAATRLAPWGRSFGPGGVYFAGDGDAYYHALRAERLARDWPRVPWTDRAMDYPYGAEIPWQDELIHFLRVFSLTPLLAPVAAVILYRAWRERPDQRLPLGFFAVFTSVFIALALARRRFDVYAAVSFALCGAVAVRHSADKLSVRLGGGDAVRWVATVGAVAVMGSTTLFPLLRGEAGEHPPGPEKIPLLKWLRDAPGMPDGSNAVLSLWSLGHEIQWFSRKPVVSTPFGTDIGKRSMRDEAAFFLADDPEAAEEILRRRKVGYLFLRNPIPEIAILSGFLPDRPPRVIRRASPATGIGFVPGAVLRIRRAAPGSALSATLLVETNSGRAFLWKTHGIAGPSGEVALRVPYATGRNGKVLAGRYTVDDGRNRREVAVYEPQVVGGEPVVVDLSGA